VLTLIELCAYFDQMDDNIQRAKEKQFKEDLKSMAFEFYDYARGITKIQVPLKYKMRRELL